jgi:hypothetical protein
MLQIDEIYKQNTTTFQLIQNSKSDQNYEIFDKINQKSQEWEIYLQK